MDYLQVIEKMEGDFKDEKVLRESFEAYDREFREIIKSHRFMKPIDYKDVISSIEASVKRQQKEWNKNNVAKLPELMAKIFAVWTLMDLKENQA